MFDLIPLIQHQQLIMQNLLILKQSRLRNRIIDVQVNQLD
jgi:hypothetical protein